MLDQFRELVGRLEDRSSGWVARRDAAEVLGKVAQGALMALRDEKSDTGVLAKKALFELQNPKTVVGEKVPEKKATGPEGMKVVAPK